MLLGSSWWKTVYAIMVETIIYCDLLIDMVFYLASVLFIYRLFNVVFTALDVPFVCNQ